MSRLLTEQEFEDSANEDYLRDIVGGTTSAPSAPFDFKSYIYQGGADDTLATQRGLDYAKQQGLGGQATVDLFNRSLGTNFTLDDYYRVTGTQPPAATPAPTAAPVVTATPSTDLSDFTLDDYYQVTGTQPPAPTLAPTPAPTLAPQAIDNWGQDLRPFFSDPYTGESGFRDENFSAVPPGFDWKEYVRLNPDLGKAGIDTEAEAKRHYVHYGAKEDRQGAPILSLQDAINFAKTNVTGQNAFVDAGEAGPQAVP